MEEVAVSRRFKLRMALLECFDISNLLNLMEADQEMKLMLRAVLNEMGDRERIECKRALQEALLHLVKGSTRLQEMMAEIKGKCCDLEVYERIWREMVAEANKGTMEVFETTDSPEEAEVYQAVPPCKEFLESVAWWRQDSTSLCWDSEDSEDRQVFREADWGDETIEMRQKRYQRMTARKNGIDVPTRERDDCREWY